MPESANAATAAELAEHLRTVYESYIKTDAARRRSEGLSDMFGGWFSSGRHEAEPHSMVFLQEVEKTLRKLAEALRHTDDGGRVSSEVVRFVLWPKPGLKKRERSQSEWYLKAAEYYCDVLLDFLPPEELKSIRDDYAKTAPKRMMFPKERELLEKMDRQLKERG